MRRLVPGGANRSYGIQVARLAGLPSQVIARAREILQNLEGGEFDENGRPRLAGKAAGTAPDSGQLGLFVGAGADLQPGEAEALKSLRRLDLDRTTPLEAFDLLARLVAGMRPADEA